MIDLLDESLKALLRRDLPALLSGQVDISFAPPDKDFPPPSVSPPALDLFLYDVRENRELRNNEIMPERRSEGTVLLHPSPVRVDCSYLITAWPSGSAPNPMQDEHRILGAVMQSLLRYSRLPPDILIGDLQDQDLPVAVTPLQPGHLQSLAEFWQALGGKPKVALNYSVTLSLTRRPPAEEALVTDKTLRFGSPAEFRT